MEQGNYGRGYNTNDIVVAMLLIPAQELRDDLFVNEMRQAFLIGPHGKIIGRVIYEGFFCSCEHSYKLMRIRFACLASILVASV